MAQSLAHPRRAALSAGGKTFPHAGLIDFSLLDEEPIDIDTLSILGIRTAVRTVLATMPAERLGINLRMFSASSTPLPRIWSTTKRTLRGETRINFVIARVSMT